MGENGTSGRQALLRFTNVTMNLCKFTIDGDLLATSMTAYPVYFPAVGGVTGPIDEDLFEDEDLDELEEDLTNLEVQVQ